ncbi:MAG: hypothetical protein GC154_12245 [bacterium]|nr:hypothetical protein [bacterium]
MLSFLESIQHFPQTYWFYIAQLLMAMYVAFDARKQRIDSIAVWVLISLLFPFMEFLIYFFYAWRVETENANPTRKVEHP